MHKPNKIQYPIEVSKINFPKKLFIEEDIWGNVKTGALVAVAPCGDKYNEKTYLGFFIGSLPFNCCCSHDRISKELSFYVGTNPAMFVPELGELIWGIGSYWHKINSKEELKQITDDDINNTWYIKALKLFEEKEQ